jgi:hypothetical protein
MTVRIVRTLPEDSWRSFVAGHPEGNVFHTPEMFRVFGRVPGYRPEMWAALEDDRILALWLPVRITIKGGVFRAFSTRSVVYGGALCAQGSEGREALSVLLEDYDREVRANPVMTEARNLSDASGFQEVFRERGFVFEEHLNYLIDLDRDEEVIWNGLSRSVRKHIRQSRDRGLVAEDADGKGSLVVAYDLLKSVYKRVRVPLAGFELFEAAFDILGPLGMLKLVMARADGCEIGTRFVLPYKGTIVDWFTGYDRAHSELHPEERMIWEVLRWGRKNGFHVFDFGGAGRPGGYYGPREFKAKWGGALVNYGRNTHVHGPLRLRLSKAGYRLWRWGQ